MTHADIGDLKACIFCTFKLLHDAGNLVYYVVYWNILMCATTPS